MRRDVPPARHPARLCAAHPPRQPKHLRRAAAVAKPTPSPVPVDAAAAAGANSYPPAPPPTPPAPYSPRAQPRWQCLALGTAVGRCVASSMPAQRHEHDRLAVRHARLSAWLVTSCPLVPVVALEEKGSCFLRHKHVGVFLFNAKLRFEPWLKCT